MKESAVFTFCYQRNGNHAMEPLTVGHIILRVALEGTFDFTETVNNYGLKQGILCQIVRFFFKFSLKLYIQN